MSNPNTDETDNSSPRYVGDVLMKEVFGQWYQWCVNEWRECLESPEPVSGDVENHCDSQTNFCTGVKTDNEKLSSTASSMVRENEMNRISTTTNKLSSCSRPDINVFYVYLDGGIASGKTTLLRYIKEHNVSSLLPSGTDILTFEEPVVKFGHLLTMFYSTPCITTALSLQNFISSCLYEREMMVLAQLRTILERITPSSADAIEKLNNQYITAFESIEDINVCDETLVSNPSHNIVILQERSMNVAMEVFIRQIENHIEIPKPIVETLLTTLKMYMLSIDQQLATVINRFAIPSCQFNGVVNNHINISVRKLNMLLNTSIITSWSRYRERSKHGSVTMCKYPYFQSIYDEMLMFMANSNSPLRVLNGDRPVPLVFNDFVEIINNHILKC